MTKIPERFGKEPDEFKWKPEGLIRYAQDEDLAWSSGFYPMDHARFSFIHDSGLNLPASLPISRLA